MQHYLVNYYYNLVNYILHEILKGVTKYYNILRKMKLTIRKEKDKAYIVDRLLLIHIACICYVNVSKDNLLVWHNKHKCTTSHRDIHTL